MHPLARGPESCGSAMRGWEPLRFGLGRMPDGAAKRHKPSAGTRETPVGHKPLHSTTSRPAASGPPFVPPHKPGDTVVNRPFCVRFFSRRQGHWGTIRSLPRTANVRSRTSPCMGLPPTVAELCAAEGNQPICVPGWARPVWPGNSGREWAAPGESGIIASGRPLPGPVVPMPSAPPRAGQNPAAAKLVQSQS